MNKTIGIFAGIAGAARLAIGAFHFLKYVGNANKDKLILKYFNAFIVLQSEQRTLLLKQRTDTLSATEKLRLNTLDNHLNNLVTYLRDLDPEGTSIGAFFDSIDGMNTVMDNVEDLIENVNTALDGTKRFHNIVPFKFAK